MSTVRDPRSRRVRQRTRSRRSSIDSTAKHPARSLPARPPQHTLATPQNQCGISSNTSPVTGDSTLPTVKVNGPGTSLANACCPSASERGEPSSRRASTTPAPKHPVQQWSPPVTNSARSNATRSSATSRPQSINDDQAPRQSIVPTGTGSKQSSVATPQSSALSSRHCVNCQPGDRGTVRQVALLH